MNNETESLITDQRVTETLWGEVEGKPVFIYQLTNSNGTIVHVSNYGAIIKSLFVKDSAGKLADVVLGYDTLEAYMNDRYHMGSIVGRYANRISSGTIYLNGREYKIHTREGGFHLHGGKVGFNKKVWLPRVVERKDAVGIKMGYLSADGEEGFPGNLQVYVTYWLTEKDEVIAEYEASTDQATLINLTQHSYFNLAGHESRSVLDHEMQIHCRSYLPVNQMQVPNGDLATVTDTPFDFSTPKVIGRDIENDDIQLKLSSGYDHSWVLEKEHTNTLKHAATVREPVSGRILNVRSTEPSVHFYTANAIAARLPGKDGAVYNRRSSFCLETQHFPDAPHNPHFPTTVLHPEQEFYSKTVFEFSVMA